MSALPYASMATLAAAGRRTPSADVAGFATFPLPGEPGAARSARSLTRATLTDWDLDELVGDTTVVVSELVTNALRYGLPAGSRPSPLPPASEDQPLLLSLVHCERSVLCAVFDPGQDVPLARTPEPYQESGRGLKVLDALAKNWGWTTPDRHGKAVWALLAVDEPRDGGAATPQWEPLSRLLLLLELLSGPSWLKALGSTSGAVTSRAN
ncbi:ATP-binding protein [Streptomyces sp. 3MP-14]|uniref:ATP-binding protein n=1 Tax=Streptomyces mimosae TaxID=2586635 RepID=A0A5N6AF62_9ACTN|nr:MULTISPECIES: ATP-binding protein [Streptomyces]KAB8166450.1 ATP-binding protein [Streptomyces mimosae]KAB8178879.1 ATP-binding protein [Streptomyces sp. 3MP-14]